jgi:hypothetical protein
MPSHNLPAATLKNVTLETLVKMSGNELIDLWKQKHGFDLWHEIGITAKAITGSRKIKAIDKLKALALITELALKVEKARSKEKGGDRPVYITTVNQLSPKE